MLFILFFWCRYEIKKKVKVSKENERFDKFITFPDGSDLYIILLLIDCCTQIVLIFIISVLFVTWPPGVETYMYNGVKKNSKIRLEVSCCSCIHQVFKSFYLVPKRTKIHITLQASLTFFQSMLSFLLKFLSNNLL